MMHVPLDSKTREMPCAKCLQRRQPHPHGLPAPASPPHDALDAHCGGALGTVAAKVSSAGPGRAAARQPLKAACT